MGADLEKNKIAAFESAHAELKSALHRIGLTQEELASRIGVKGGTLSGNIRRQSYSTWEDIATAEPRLTPIFAALLHRIADIYMAQAGEAMTETGRLLAKKMAAAGPDALMEPSGLQTIRDLHTAIGQFLKATDDD